jgi:Phage integrase family
VRWLKKGEPMPAWIFPSPEGTALEERNVRTVFARLLAKADMRQICIHDLRHTYSTLLLQAGANHLRQPAARTSGRLDHATGLRSLAAPCVAPRRSARPATTDATPVQRKGGSDDESTERKSFVLNGEPPRNRTENPQIKSSKKHAE